MRKGVLVAQDTPNAIMQRNHCASLEEAFLKLCMSQEVDQLKTDPDLEIINNFTHKQDGRKRKYFSPQTLKALMYKSFVQFIRQPT